MHIHRGKSTEGAAASVAASSSSMPGAFDAEPQGKHRPGPRLAPPIECWECHLLSIGVGMCHHRKALLSDDEDYSEAVSDEDEDEHGVESSADSVGGIHHPISSDEVADRTPSPQSEHSSALWVGVSPGSSFLADNTSALRTPTPPPSPELPPALPHAQHAAHTEPVAVPVVQPQHVAQALPVAQPQLVPHVVPVVQPQPIAQPVLAVQPAANVAHVQAAALVPAVHAVQPLPAGNRRVLVDAHLATNGIVAHYDPNDPTFTGRWYVVTRGRIVGVFRRQGPASHAVNGFAGQNWFHARPYDEACEAFYDCALAGAVSNQPSA
ncbi:hypothetical protein K466DRAFT_605692 [Polyporus arcularius HHB13444]|uniref:Uncharacterized protein n=1 Tax=Polyporus arcularius HHB13444 TaxID=1314778 RepID=A0A5C3NRP3_9APHY|nr:hypothetical protein K466DRAFT_605692 [Polyporus arcularius HHB13444]